MEGLQGFIAEMERAGLIPSEVVPDGQLRRCPTADKPRGENGWYVFYADPMAGAYGDWARGFKETCCQSCNGGLDPETRRRLQKEIEKARAAREQAEAERHEQKAEEVRRTLEALPPADDSNPYLQKKGVHAVPGLKQDADGNLVVPGLQEDGRPSTYQVVPVQGKKLFMSGGKAAGAYFPIRGDDNKALIVCEGIATGLSLHEADPAATVLVSFSASNLEPVALMARRFYPKRSIILAGDDDRGTKSKTGTNPGREAALRAARAVGGKVALPVFQEGDATDFNDLHAAEGIEAVKKALEKAEEPPEESQIHVLNLREFLSLELPPRDFILSPIIPTQGLVMLYALRGVGKTGTSALHP